MIKHFKEYPLSLWEKIGFSCCTLALILSLFLTVIENTSICSECGKSFFGSGYYDYTETLTLCKDCARTYWMPLPYQNYKK